MDAFAPELAPHWFESHAAAADDWTHRPGDEAELSPAQQVALEELAELVTAARSVF